MEPANTDGTPVSSTSAMGPLREIPWFGFHLLVLYVIVNVVTRWLAEFVRGTLLPFIQQHQPSNSYFQFAFSHLFIFGFYPALVVGFILADWRREKAALFVWMVPLAILTYKFATFHVSSSVLDDGSGDFAAAFHQYFSGDFIIADYHSYKELFEVVGPNPDMTKGMDQYRYTAPFYAAIGYSAGALLAMKMPIAKLGAKIKSMRPAVSGDE